MCSRPHAIRANSWKILFEARRGKSRLQGWPGSRSHTPGVARGLFLPAAQEIDDAGKIVAGMALLVEQRIELRRLRAKRRHRAGPLRRFLAELQILQHEGGCEAGLVAL